MDLILPSDLLKFQTWRRLLPFKNCITQGSISFFMIHSVTWNTVTAPRADAVTGTEAPAGITNWKLRWAELRRTELGREKVANKDTLVSPCPFPIPSLPCAWRWRMHPMRRKAPKELPDPWLLAFGTPWACHCTIPGMSSSWAAMLTAHGASWTPSIHQNSNSFGLLQPPLSHNHVPQPSPREENSVWGEAIAEHGK